MLGLGALQLTGAGGGEWSSLVTSSSAAGPKVSTWQCHLVVALKGTACRQELLFPCPSCYPRPWAASWRILPVTTLMGSLLSPPASPGPPSFIRGPHGREGSMPAYPRGRSQCSLWLTAALPQPPASQGHSFLQGGGSTRTDPSLTQLLPVRTR